ncbi:MAG: flavin monoamine oxidase family protein, partial [Hyphomicrobiales bacterium]
GVVFRRGLCHLLCDQQKKIEPGMSEVDVVIIGAGAAGLGAARTLQRLGKSFVLLEASHRIGGRAYTEEVRPGVPFDLGCHWLHSASLNPFVKIADELGVTYTKDGFPRNCFENGRWVSAEEIEEWEAFFDAQFTVTARFTETGRDASVFDVTERESRWTPAFDYILSLYASMDVDQISAADLISYRDTEENWPLKDGYGTLISRFGADVPVTLNAAVSEIDWTGPRIRATSSKGTVSADAVLITVSTGILGAGDIRFTPALPDWKLEAVANLPLGNHNRICLVFDRDVFGPDVPAGFMAITGDEVPMSFHVRPYGFDYVVGVTGGRFADWLERAGQQASVGYATEKLVSVFGSDVAKHITGHNVTAWRGDPWVKGAYANALPGQFHQRAKLAEPINGRLYFAGEATHPEFFTTAHGAYLSGIAAAERLA